MDKIEAVNKELETYTACVEFTEKFMKEVVPLYKGADIHPELISRAFNAYLYCHWDAFIYGVKVETGMIPKRSDAFTIAFCNDIVPILIGEKEFDTEISRACEYYVLGRWADYVNLIKEEVQRCR